MSAFNEKGVKMFGQLKKVIEQAISGQPQALERNHKEVFSRFCRFVDELEMAVRTQEVKTQ